MIWSALALMRRYQSIGKMMVQSVGPVVITYDVCERLVGHSTATANFHLMSVGDWSVVGKGLTLIRVIAN